LNIFNFSMINNNKIGLVIDSDFASKNEPPYPHPIFFSYETPLRIQSIITYLEKKNIIDDKRINLIKPTIKKYLYSHVRSQFLRIDFDEAALAVYLPVQQFRKASESKVWADSRRSI